MENSRKVYHYNMSEQSGNFNDVLGKPPIRSWKWSIFLVLVMIALIGAVTWWLDYRNAVEVELRIFTKDKSLEFFADQAGQIEKKWLQNGAVVKKNQPVFSFKTSANFEDVIKLKDALQKDANTTLPKGSYGVLSVEADEVQKLQNQLAILKGSGVERQAFFLKQSADSLRQSLENIDTQIAMIREEIQIAKDNFREYQLLHETGAASRLEVNSAKTQWIHYQKELEVKLDEKKQLNARILLQSGESNQLLSTKKEQISLLEATISAKKSQLYHQIELWQKEHLILAPKDGVLYFNQGYGWLWWVSQREIGDKREIGDRPRFTQ